jgi:hypothetical protein
VLITRVNLGEGRLNGGALARMLHYNRRRNIKIVFVGQSANEHYVDGEGEFLSQALVQGSEGSVGMTVRLGL